MSMGLEWKNGDHEVCLVDELVKLLDRGYFCYLEHDLFSYHEKKAHHKLTVDIFAIKGKSQIIVEIGTLSPRKETDNRLSFIKQFAPSAQVIWVHQWKNYGITNSRMEILGYYQRVKNDIGTDEWAKRVGAVLSKME